MQRSLSQPSTPTSGNLQRLQCPCPTTSNLVASLSPPSFHRESLFAAPPTLSCSKHSRVTATPLEALLIFLNDITRNLTPSMFPEILDGILMSYRYKSASAWLYHCSISPESIYKVSYLFNPNERYGKRVLCYKFISHLYKSKSYVWANQLRIRIG